MVEFFRKFEYRSIKIAQVNSIRITKSVNLEFFNLILHCVLVRCDRRKICMLSPFIEYSILLYSVAGALMSIYRV